MTSMTTATILAATAVAMSTCGSPLSTQAFKTITPPTQRCNPVPFSSPMMSSDSITACYQRSKFKRRRRFNSDVLAASKGTVTFDQAIDNIDASESDGQTITRLNRNEKLFQKRLSELQDYRTQHGHGSIPTPYPPNPPLGIWAANLRRQYALWERAERKNNHNERRGGGYIGYLTPERRHQLIAAGFDFTSLTERQFQMKVGELKIFKERYGHCMVPEKWEENKVLGAWVSNLRTLYKRKMEHQKQQLMILQSQQNEGKNHEPQKKQRRSINMLLQSPAHPRKKRQRTPRFSHLDEDRISLLEEMGFVWSSTDRKWLIMLEWAKVYGVVNYQLKLPVGSTHDVDQNCIFAEGDDDGDHGNDWGIRTGEQSNKKNRNNLIDNYHQFLSNIQDPSLLPRFHQQDEILTMLLNKTHIQSIGPVQDQALVQEQSTLVSKNDTLHHFEPSCLDYHIPPNDTAHQPLRIWMINQRSNYNRLHGGDESNPSTGTLPSTMTPQRQQALEAIHFPWSGRFPNRVAEVQHEMDVIAKRERQLEKERRIAQKEREEQERVEQLTSSLVASVSASTSSTSAQKNKVGDIVVVEEVAEEVDIMALWDAEDDDDDDW